jgi:uncharacterized protein YdhG (YjbR/CyaY superfamily)
MVQSKAETVDEYLEELPDDRRAAISKVRAVVRKNLPKGYRERVGYGMITYEIPLEKYPDTYNGQPLCYLGLASQKNHMALYLTNVYGNPALEKFLAEAFQKAGKKMDMGKSCLRFKKVEDLPLDAIGRIVASTPVEELIAKVRAVHEGRKKTRKAPSKKTAAKKK